MKKMLTTVFILLMASLLACKEVLFDFSNPYSFDDLNAESPFSQIRYDQPGVDLLGEFNEQYKEYQQIDNNNDGYLNIADKDVDLLQTIKDMDSMINLCDDYINEDYQKDVMYAYLLDMDLNKDGEISEFEWQIEKYKLSREIEPIMEIKDRAIEEGHLNDFQKEVALYTIYSYFGETTKVEEVVQRLAQNYPQSNFEILNQCIHHSVGCQYNNYQFNKQNPRSVLDTIFIYSAVQSIHTKEDSIDKLEEDLSLLFPNAFSHRYLMVKLLNRVLYEIYNRMLSIDKLKEEETDSEQLQQINKVYTELETAFNELDTLVAAITPLDFSTSYVQQRTNELMNKLQILILEEDEAVVNTYEQAKTLLNQFIEKYNISDSEFAIAVNAFLKVFVENKKPAEETDYLFSPDIMFSKGYGVCVDQSFFISLILQDKGIEDCTLYMWNRPYYWGHLNVYFQNLDGTYYIFDNYGLANNRYDSLDEALEKQMVLSSQFRKSLEIKEGEVENISWMPIELGEESRIGTMDHQYYIKFSELKDIQSEE